jgi:hypothetical protein
MLAAAVIFGPASPGAAPASPQATAPGADSHPGQRSDRRFMVRHVGEELRLTREQQSLAYTVVLREAPASDVVLRVQPTKSLRADHQALRFTPEDWYIPQAVGVWSSVGTGPGARRAKRSRRGFVLHSIAAGPRDWVGTMAPAVRVRLAAPARPGRR